MQIFLGFIVFLLGLSIGSFLNVVIFRLHAGKKIGLSRSACMQCKNELVAKDLIPVFSYVFLGGKCRSCGAKISVQYPFVEFTTGVLFLILYVGFFEHLLQFLFLALFTALFIVVFVYDLKHFIIPNKIVFFGFVFGVLYVCLFFLQDVHLYFLGSMMYGFFMLFLYFISDGKWMGGGDVKLAFFIGLILGFPDVLFSIIFSFVFGSVVALLLIALGKTKRKDMVPFGTFMTVSAFVSFFVARIVIDWYWSLIYF